MKRCFRVGLVVLALSLSAWAQQGSVTRLAVEGEVSQDHGSLPNGLTVEAYDLKQHVRVDRAIVMPDGRFEFRSLGAGQYLVRIVNLRGDVIREDFAAINGSRERLSLQIPGDDVTRRAAGTISAASLRPVPRKAAKEFLRSQKALEAGQVRESMEHLEKAIQFHPDYMQAHNNLGVRHMALEQYDKAAAEFQKTVALDPVSAKGYLNLSVALAVLGRYPEAETAARRALQLDAHSVPARYELGQILAVEGKNMPEALEHLRKATEQYPGAHLIRARILVLQGDINEAVVELREYLKSGDAKRKRLAESWLAKVQP